MIKLTRLNTIKSYPIREDRDILTVLLKDRTTRKNIIWGTTSYQDMGKGYQAKDHIREDLLNNGASQLVKPRVEKDDEEQNKRTRGKGEVFTPTWIIKEKINLIEDELSKLDLEDYIDKRWLEITCGEAPYMTSRYDTVTGKYLEIENRVGFLDRKLQRISKEIESEQIWFSLALRAYQASYGYEYQGDSLLIARENLFNSFIDYYVAKFNYIPEPDKMEAIARIISYNVFQMDGLKYNLPIAKKIRIKESDIQLSIFGDIEKEDQQLEVVVDKGEEVKIKNWFNDRMIKFKDLVENRGGERTMKFDVVIGNPPYQETIGKTKSQSQANTTWIYHYFQEAADKLGDITCLIYPFGGWFDNHSALRGLGKRNLSDGHTRVIKAFEGSDDKRAWYREDKDPNPIFGKGVNLSAGVAIVLRNMSQIFESYEYSNRVYSDKIKTVYYSDGINVSPSPDFTFGAKLGKKKLIDRLNKNPFKIESNFVELNPEKVSLEKDGFKDPILLLTNDKAGSAGRTTRFYCERDTIAKGEEYIDHYKVIMPSAYPKKTLTSGGPNIKNVKKRLSQLVEVLPSNSAHGRSRMMLFNSKDKRETDNFIKYVKTNFFAFLVLQEPNRRSSIGQIIPDQDFTTNSDIDWSKSIAEIDQQLYKKYGLNEKEINFIESNAKGME